METSRVETSRIALVVGGVARVVQDYGVMYGATKSWSSGDVSIMALRNCPSKHNTHVSYCPPLLKVLQRCKHHGYVSEWEEGEKRARQNTDTNTWPQVNADRMVPGNSCQGGEPFSCSIPTSALSKAVRALNPLSPHQSHSGPQAKAARFPSSIRPLPRPSPGPCQGQDASGLGGVEAGTCGFNKRRCGAGRT